MKSHLVRESDTLISNASKCFYFYKLPSVDSGYTSITLRAFGAAQCSQAQQTINLSGV